MDEGRHILICGDVGVGKSTLIRRLLEYSRRPLYGFVTKRSAVPDRDGLFSVRIRPAAQSGDEWDSGPKNLVGATDRARCFRYPEVFDGLGADLLRAPARGLILMDELGFLESGAERFCSGVLRTLDGDIPVLAAMKSRDTDFLRAVRDHPNGALFRITKENRDALFPLLLPRILRWNGELTRRTTGPEGAGAGPMYRAFPTAGGSPPERDV